MRRHATACRPFSLAAATEPAGSDIVAIDHIVFLMMENRSYDHYFGAYPKGRGFDDHPENSLGVFAQDYPGGSSSPAARVKAHLLDVRLAFARERPASA